MSNLTYHSSRPDKWVQPRPYSDPSHRMQKYGRVLPMDEPGFFSRLLGLR